MSFSFIKKITSRAFTLVEFIVIISIFAIIATIALFNFGSFSSNVSLSNLAHDVALSIREAQVYGISATSGILPENPIPHGTFFEFTNNSFTPTITLFDDIDGNGIYSGNPIEFMDSLSIQSLDYISDITVGSSLTPCTDDVGIVFVRPDPNPEITCGTMQGYSEARITVSSADGTRTKVITIHRSGQIAVE